MPPYPTPPSAGLFFCIILEPSYVVRRAEPAAVDSELCSCASNLDLDVHRRANAPRKLQACAFPRTAAAGRPTRRRARAPNCPARTRRAASRRPGRARARTPRAPWPAPGAWPWRGSAGPRNGTPGTTSSPSRLPVLVTSQATRMFRSSTPCKRALQARCIFLRPIVLSRAFFFLWLSVEIDPICDQLPVVIRYIILISM